jgi:uncharacterized protein YndB with AHSA1/START domain
MWSTKASAETSGSADAVWAAWEDAAHWNRWHPMIQDSHLDGPFAARTRGTVTPTKGRKGSFELTEVQPPKSWASRARMPGGALDFRYALTPTDTGTRITMEAAISGPLGFLYRRMIGRLCEEGLPAAVQNLKAIAEQVPAAP